MAAVKNTVGYVIHFSHCGDCFFFCHLSQSVLTWTDYKTLGFWLQVCKILSSSKTPQHDLCYHFPSFILFYFILVPLWDYFCGDLFVVAFAFFFVMLWSFLYNLYGFLVVYVCVSLCTHP